MPWWMLVYNTRTILGSCGGHPIRIFQSAEAMAAVVKANVSNAATKGMFNMNSNSPKRQIISYLADGNSLTKTQIRRKFGVRNPRATLSDVRSTVEAYGNWAIVEDGTYGGETQYAMKRVALVCPTIDSDDLADLY